MKRTEESAAAVAKRCARILDQYKMENVRVVDVGNALQITDYFVIASGRNQRHVKAASNELLKELRQAGTSRRGLEGYRDGKWVLLDFADVVVHLFVNESREFYDLEHLWGDCPTLDWHGGKDAGGSAERVSAGRN